MSDYPEAFEIPSLNSLNEEPLIFGLPRKQASIVVGIGGGVALATVIIVGFIFGVAVLFIVTSTLLAILKGLYSRDPYWFQHITTNKIELDRYIGN